jgi:uncharacterized membrane protein YfcA
MLTSLDPTTPLAWLVASYAVFGVGFGFVNAPITNAAVSGMPRAQAGVAVAIATTSRQFGQALGVRRRRRDQSRRAPALRTGRSSLWPAIPAWWTLTALGLVVSRSVLAATAGAQEVRRAHRRSFEPEASNPASGAGKPVGGSERRIPR